MHLMEQYFYEGKVIASYEEALRAKNSDVHEQSQLFIKMYEKYDVHIVPAPIAGEQQQERPDEQYDAMDDVLALRQVKDETMFQQMVQQLEKTAKEGEAIKRAQSFFTQGQLFLFAHHYDESVHCFKLAVQNNPSLAVYYGICAQTMNRLAESPITVLAYIERAIELDETNARWYWIRALVLLQLYKDLKKDMFLENTLVNLERAKMLTRADQKSLLVAIDNTFETVKEYVLHN
ncbi:MAG: O-linked GlcNAc transferase [Lysinibacillus sp.]